MYVPVSAGDIASVLHILSAGVSIFPFLSE